MYPIRIHSGIPKIREDGPINEFTNGLSADDVDVYFNVGVHHDYRFSGEFEHNQKENKKLTKEFGLYFICNDRVIVAHSTEKKHGFKAAFHSEHNGFICHVRMVSENPALLPWNTAKTEIKVHNPLFLKLLKKIEPLTLRYRSDAKAVIKIWLDPGIKSLPNDKRKTEFQNILNLPSSKDKIKKDSRSTEQNSIQIKKQSPQPSLFGADDLNKPPIIKSSPNNKLGAKKNQKRHTTNWQTLILEHFPISGNNPTLDNIIIEAAKLEISTAPHASCLLYRSLLEASLKQFATKSGNFKNVISHYYSQGEGKKKAHNDDYKKNQSIDLSMTLHWLLDNKELFIDSDRKKLHQCVKCARTHIKKMNGVVHCLHIISDMEVVKIRNETIELLEFLVTEKSPTP